MDSVNHWTLGFCKRGNQKSIFHTLYFLWMFCKFEKYKGDFYGQKSLYWSWFIYDRNKSLKRPRRWTLKGSVYSICSQTVDACLHGCSTFIFTAHLSQPRHTAHCTEFLPAGIYTTIGKKSLWYHSYFGQKSTSLKVPHFLGDKFIHAHKCLLPGTLCLIGFWKWASTF